jgi:iron complex transport system ATP-binding protein
MNLQAPPLATEGLKLSAAGRSLLRGLDWRVQRGERWGVIGRNAVGKSTLLRALAGLAVPRRQGRVQWFGRDLAQWGAPDAARVRAYAPQQPSDRFSISVRRLLELGMVVPGVRDAATTLQSLDAADLAERDVMQLSGGERQRVALAQCALQGTPLMLLDEPVAFQDPAHQIDVARWLTGLSDVALVFSAHDVNWVARAATHVLVLHGDGAADAGTVAAMLEPQRLARAYGCAWRDVGGVWVAG